MPVELSEGFIRFVAGFVGLLIGWAVGFFDSKLRADRKIRAAEEKAQIAVQQAKGEAERAAMAAQTALEAASARPAGTTLLRLWLDAAERPALDLDGQRVETAPLSEHHRKRMLTLLNVMRPWIEGKPAPAPPPAAPRPAPAAAPASIPPPVFTSTATPPASKEEKPASPLSIVGQIDEILQARLASTLLVNRGIRLQESPEGGVIVWVGMKKFSGVDEVPDPDVQAVIRAAIAEWEKKYSPG